MTDLWFSALYHSQLHFSYGKQIPSHIYLHLFNLVFVEEGHTT